jgi:hypothetical protein
LVVALICGGAGCAARSPTTQPGNGAVSSANFDVGAAIPFALCRSFGTAGTPCYPTNVDIGSRFIGPCRERQRGHCELSGPRQTMACLLAPVPDGKAGGVCKDGVCTTQ